MTSENVKKFAWRIVEMWTNMYSLKRESLE